MIERGFDHAFNVLVIGSRLIYTAVARCEIQRIAALVYNCWVDPVLGHFGITRVANIVSNDILGTDANLLAVFILPIDILLAWLVNRLFTRPLARLA